MPDEYKGQAKPQDSSSDYNAMSFIIKAIAGKMMTATLVQVKDVDADTVDVQPMVAMLDGFGKAMPHGTVYAMPIWRLQGGVSSVIVVPAVGDIGLAVFCREDVSSVRANKAPSNPGSGRRYSYADGIYLGGVLNSPATQFLRMDADGIAITSLGAITITAPTSVTIDSPMTMFTGDIQTGAGSTFNGKSFDTHVHGSVQSGTSNSGPPV